MSKDDSQDELNNIMRGEENKSLSRNKSIILLAIVAVVIVISFTFSLMNAGKLSQFEIDENREDYLKSLKAEVANSKQNNIFRNFSFKDDALIIELNTNDPSWTGGKILTAKDLNNDKYQKMADALCKDGLFRIRKPLGITQVVYQYFKDNNLSYEINVSEINCQ